MKYLILGLGEVGLTIAKTLLKNPQITSLHIHTNRKASLTTKLNILYQESLPCKLTGSWGDIFSISECLNCESEGINYKSRALSYFYGKSTNDWYHNSLIYTLLERERPDIVIDTVTLATYFKNQGLPSLYDNYSGGEKIAPSILEDFLLRNPTSILSNFVQSLQASIREFSIKHYLKVSTSGFGGMGFNCPYTHGSLVSNRLDFHFQGKMSAAGTLHQLLWNLHDSELARISLIVPKALIGYDAPFLVHHKQELKVIIRSINNPNMVETKELFLKNSIRIPCGDSTNYSLEEVILSSSLGQFEMVTKEEVSNAVLETISGGSRFDLFHAINSSCLGSSYFSRFAMERVVKFARRIQGSETHSVVSGNFGQYTAKILSEIHILMSVGYTFLNDIACTPLEASKRCAEFIQSNEGFCSQILSTGLIIFTNNSYICSDRDDLAIEGIQQNTIVDLRESSISNWFVIFEKMRKKVDEFENYFAFSDSISSGKLAAAYFMSIGKSRKYLL